jgi:hypothetical protein
LDSCCILCAKNYFRIKIFVLSWKTIKVFCEKGEEGFMTSGIIGKLMKTGKEQDTISVVS